MGPLLALMVHSALAFSGPEGASTLLVRLFLHLECLKTIFVDGGCTGSPINWALSMSGWSMQVIKRRQRHGFEALPKRWIVERSFA